MINNNANKHKSWHRTLFDGVDERMYKDSPTGINSDNEGSILTYLTPGSSSISISNGKFVNISGIAGVNVTPGGQFQIGIRRDDALFPTNKKRISLLTYDGTTSREALGSTDLVVDTMYYIVVQSNGSAWKIFINGVEETLTMRSGTNTGLWFSDFSYSGTPRFALGNTYRQNAWAPISFNGYLGGYLITSEVLTQAQITALYNNGQPLDPLLFINKTQARIYWQMGDTESGVISTVYDSISGNNLTSENMENADIVSSNYY